MKADNDFGVEPGAATPDDIWDFNAERRSSKHGTICLLGPLAQQWVFVK